MRFEYLISEKGKQVLGTERMVRNCQRPKGRRSLLPAQEPLCSRQEASSKDLLSGAEQGWFTAGDGASNTQACGWFPQQSLAWEFSLHSKTKIGPSNFR